MRRPRRCGRACGCPTPTTSSSSSGLLSFITSFSTGLRDRSGPGGGQRQDRDGSRWRSHASGQAPDQASIPSGPDQRPSTDRSADGHVVTELTGPAAVAGPSPAPSPGRSQSHSRTHEEVSSAAGVDEVRGNGVTDVAAVAQCSRGDRRSHGGALGRRPLSDRYDTAVLHTPFVGWPGPCATVKDPCGCRDVTPEEADGEAAAATGGPNVRAGSR
jgi:hypothetical protein